jgi:hypothetical protein
MRGLRMVILVLAPLVATQGTAQTTPPATLIKAAHLIDPRTASTLSPADVIVPQEAQVKRMTFNGEFEPGLLLAVAGMTPSARGLLGAKLVREDLKSGFTTVRNVGHSGIDGDIALRDAINAGRVPGPRLLASGRKITAPGEYFRASIGGDPLTDIGELERVRFVMKGGQIIRNDFSAQ